MPFGTPGAYPTPSGGGPRIAKLHQYQPAYGEVMEKHIYEDGGASYQTRNDEAPIRFLLEYTGLSLAEAATLDAHRADAFGEVYGFNFTNPRTTVAYTDVHYDESFQEDHRKTWNNTRTIHLIKRPV